MTPEELRRYCLSMPGAVEEFPFSEGVSVFKVGGKMFALSPLAREPLEVSVKSSPTLPWACATPTPAIRPALPPDKRHCKRWSLSTAASTTQMVRDMVEDLDDLVVDGLPKSSGRSPPGPQQLRRVALGARRSRQARAAPTPSSAQVSGSSRNAAYSTCGRRGR